jgi:hypothetical protein
VAPASAAPPSSAVPADSSEDDNPFASKPKAGAGIGRNEMIIYAVTIGLALLLILNRNGILYGIAKSIGAESTYTSIDSALGGPSLDTERGVVDFVEHLKEKSSAQAADAPEAASSK